MEFVQWPYERILMLLHNTVGRIGKERGQRVASRIACILLFGFFTAQRLQLPWGFLQDLTSKGHVFTGLLLLFLLVDVREKPKVVSLRPLPLFLYLFMVFWMTLAWYLHPISPGYGNFILSQILVFPLFYVLWNNEETRERMIDDLTWGALVVFALLAVWHMIKQPLAVHAGSAYRYSGAFQNANTLGKSCVEAAIVALYRIHERKSGKWMGFFVIGSSVLMSFLAHCRTAEIVLLLVLLAATILVFRRWEEDHRKGKDICVAVAGIALGAFITWGGLTIPVTKWDYHGIPDKEAMTPAITAVQSENLIGHAGKPYGIKLRRIDYTDWNTISSGRLGLYKEAWDDMNLFGHPLHGEFITLSSGTIVGGYHNSPLEYGYRFGWPAGVALLLMDLLAAAYVLRKVFGKHTACGTEVFAVLTFIAYGITSMLELQMLPFGYGTVTLFWLCLGVLLRKEEL